MEVIRMNRRNLALATISGAALLASTTLMGAPPAAAPTKIGFIYVSPVGDAGWTYQHDLGRKQMEAAMKGAVTTKFIENVPEGADAERIIRQLAVDGNQIIFTTSFGYMNQTVKVATSFPDVAFFHATGYKTAKNVGIYNARFYEGRYLNGVIAGKMTKTNKAGYVAAFPIPEVVMGINAFARGMRSVNPKAEVNVIWVNSWFDPGKERDAAMTLIAQGADMITHHTDSTAVVQAAEEKHKEKGTWAFSYHSDMTKYGPTAQLSGTTHIWGDFYTKIVKDVLAKKWTGTNLWGGLKDGMIQLAPMSKSVPLDLQKQVHEMEAGIKAGKLHPFAGPVVDQAGKEVLPKGKNMSDSDMNAMNYYVQGVTSVFPKN
jgi:simple sugar transport system substrate-binding protein